ncbi:hypothetical protein [Campylobacter troglodytis]|uniref:hypothetical protein n=1 Tax=Campylobacter troglodytis TaxID=654363 RepID=UPI00163C28AF|nr:hypothetical protein [Campylobacter troglodytis]
MEFAKSMFFTSKGDILAIASAAMPNLTEFLMNFEYFYSFLFLLLNLCEFYVVLLKNSQF